jgi:ABC-type multidrug transport system permease subunit
MAGAGVLVLVLVIYTGFVIRIPEMPDWFGWIRWINPIVSLLSTPLLSAANIFSLVLCIRDSACQRVPRSRFSL